MKIAIISDSNAGISMEEAKEMGVFIQPSPFFINDKIEFAGVTMTHEQFYAALQDDAVDVKTSMPSPGDMTDTWDELLKTHDEVLFYLYQADFQAQFQLLPCSQRTLTAGFR